MAAAFGLLNFPPATAHFSKNSHLFLLSPSYNPCLLSLTTTTTKRRRANLQLFIVQSTPQVEAIPAAVQSEAPEENVAEEDEVSQTRLLLQNVPWTCTADDIRPLVEKFGTVVDIEFSMYNKSRNRGLAFVTMGSHEEAVAALTSLNSSLNWAKPKKVKPSTVAEPKPLPVHNLYVTNLPFQARAKDLRDFFNADNANVVSAEIIFQDTPRRSAGYGFVSFNTKAEAEAALTAFQGKEFMGRSIRVAFSKRFLRQATKATIESESVEAAS
ncbi:hypothetical protein ABFS82_14G271100 [Erythranthe guttata]